jgi:hypothetical protein
MAKNGIVEINEEDMDKEYFISTKDEKDEFMIYGSDLFKLSEIDLINLIKVCLIEARNKTIGRKLLAIYRDSTEKRKHITQARLKLIGVEDEQLPKPTKERKARIK